MTYSDVGGCKEQIEKLREVVETPLLHPERFVNLGIGDFLLCLEAVSALNSLINLSDSDRPFVLAQGLSLFK